LVLGVGLVLCAIVLVHGLFKGRRAAGNPWGSASLEWTCSSPPPPHNFATTPVAGDPHDYSRLMYEGEERGYATGKRESE
jgi:cytochrome c oxidase subunit 1